MKKIVVSMFFLVIAGDGPLLAAYKPLLIPSAHVIKTACEVFRNPDKWRRKDAFDYLMDLLNNNILHTQEYKELTSGANRNTPTARRLSDVVQAIGLYINALSRVPLQVNEGPKWYNTLFLPAYKQLKKVQPSYISLGRADVVRDIERVLRAFINEMLKAEVAADAIKYGH